jgi:DNA-binding CsgD family transcriptional regulator
MEQPFVDKFGLTTRELATAQAVLDGLTYKDTAALLSISPTTVKSHILSVYQKTGAGNKIELLRLVEAERARLHQKVNGPPVAAAPS